MRNICFYLMKWNKTKSKLSNAFNGLFLQTFSEYSMHWWYRSLGNQATKSLSSHACVYCNCLFIQSINLIQSKFTFILSAVLVKFLQPNAFRMIVNICITSKNKISEFRYSQNYFHNRRNYSKLPNYFRKTIMRQKSFMIFLNNIMTKPRRDNNNLHNSRK